MSRELKSQPKEQKLVKIWKAWNKFTNGKYAWVVESFDAVEQPTRYKLAKMQEAFSYRAMLDKSEACLTREDALEKALSNLDKSVEAAEQRVRSLEEAIRQVACLQVSNL